MLLWRDEALSVARSRSTLHSREAVVIDHISGAAAALATPHPERRRTRRNEPNHATDHENQKSNTHDNLQRETVSVRTPPQD